MKQHARTLVKTIRPDKVEDLREKLRLRGDDVQKGIDGRFRDVPGLHFLSCCILGAEHGVPQLVVELSFEGEVREFFEWVVAHKGAALDELLSACDGYPGPAETNREAVIRYLLERARENVVYLGTPGRSLAQIGEEEGLRARVMRELDRTRTFATTRARRWQSVADAIYKCSPELRTVPKRPLRVRANLADPALRARLFAALRLTLLGVAWLAGVLAALVWAREPWQLGLVLGPAVLLGGAATGLFLWGSPRGLTVSARARVRGAALREGLATALAVLPLGGLALAAIELPLDRVAVATAALWAAETLLALVTVVVVAAFAFSLAGRVAGVVAALAAALLLARFPQALVPVLGLTVGLALVLAVGFAYAIRKLEAASEVWDGEDDLAHLELVKRREYQQLHSHLASETPIEDRALRLWTVRSVLRWVDLIGRYWYNRGHLQTISTIHFARWLVLPGRGDRGTLVFLSNYDDRFEDYLGDFAAVMGVTAIWGNVVGFPRPFLLVYDGARAENLFKRYARRSQVESLVWYSAYPTLSVDEIDEATYLREQLARPIDHGETGVRAALRRVLHPPLDELALVGLMDGR